jgi:hypothetical protein
MPCRLKAEISAEFTTRRTCKEGQLAMEIVADTIQFTTATGKVKVVADDLVDALRNRRDGGRVKPSNFYRLGKRLFVIPISQF